MSRRVAKNWIPALDSAVLAVGREFPALLPVLDRITFDALQRAKLRVQAQWPIRTGRSLLAWNVVRRGPLWYQIRNDARDRRGQYAGYVHWQGWTTAIQYVDGARGGLERELDVAAREIDAEALQAAAGAPPSARRPGVAGLRSEIVINLRATIARALTGSVTREVLEAAGISEEAAIAAGLRVAA